MKIRQLKFKNINSFYGEHAPINFSQEPLGSAGLFMICGPTGAGKSTLLDVITLALFNEVPRIGKISKQEIESRGLLINAKAAIERSTEAFAEVEYEVEEVVYRSRWSIKKNRNDRWNDYEMEVAVLPDGKILESKKSEVPKKNTEIIKLEYKQFVQSIILAQGSFAKFLQANRNDRAKLLEDITGTHIYRQLGAASHMRANEANNALTAKQSLMQGITLLSTEEEQALVEECTSLKNRLTTIDEELARWTQEMTLVQKLTESEQQLQRITNLLQVNQEKSIQFTAKKQQIEQHESVVEFVEELTILDQQQNQKTRLEQQLTQTSQLLTQLEQKRIHLLEKASTLVGSTLDESIFEERLSAFTTQVLALQQLIQQSADQDLQQRALLQNEIQSTQHPFSKRIQSATSFQESIALIQTEQTRIQPSLAVFPENFNADEQIELLATKQAKYNELQRRLQEIQRVIELGINKKNEQTQLASELTTTEQLLKQLQAELLQLENLLQEQKKKRDRDLSRQSLKDMKAMLQPGEPCPLCGSTEHPAPMEHFVSALVELNEQILLGEAQLTAKKQEERQLQSRKTQLETKIESLKEQLTQLREELIAHKQEVQSAKSELALTSEDLSQAIEAQLAQLQSYKQAIADWRDAKECSVFIQRVKPIYELLLQLQTQVIQQKQQLAAIYSGKNIQQDTDYLKQQWHQCTTEIKNARTAFTDYTNESTNVTTHVQSLWEHLQAKLLAKGITKVEEVRSRLLSQHVYQQLVKEKEELASERISLHNQSEQMDKQIKELIASRKMGTLGLSELENESEQLRKQRDEIIRNETEKRTLLRANDDNKKRFESIQQELQLLQEEYRKWDLLKNYIGDANGNKFNNFAQNLTLANLISLANLRLKGLSERYILTKLAEDPDHLYVYDTYQGHTVRSVDTLSGGETFTLSLALALALSDMASRNVRIDSLFIDEGFGTLDEETLDTAIYTLEKLQNENLKTVGVISHRGEMKERIPVQIQIDKGLEGCSTISIVCK